MFQRIGAKAVAFAGGVFVSAALLAGCAGGAHAQQQPPGKPPTVFGIGAPRSAGELPPGAFRDSLLALSPQARGRALGILQRLSTPAADFEFMRVDKKGGVFYVDPAPQGAATGDTTLLPQTTLTATDVFKLHSKPGASTILYVDFDGATLKGTAWNSSSGQTVLNMLPFDLDGDPTTFSQAELTRISESWRRVAEDFADFDVDVTTEEPPHTTDPATGRTDYALNVGHNLVTQEIDANGHYSTGTGSCSCGGIAYVGVWGNSNYLQYQPALTFNRSLGSNAMSISHETGHNLGLSHDGTSSLGYYSGHGSGATSWGPIMGAPFGKSVVTWSRAGYPDANNNQDDYAIIAGHLSLRTDDHADVTLADATPLVVTNGTDVVSTTRVTDTGWSDLANKGVIGTPSDVDLFSMSVGTGTISLTIDPATHETFEGTQGANLDIQATLLDSAGNVLQTSNPDLALGATISYAVTIPGTYYLEVTGVGRAGSGTDYGYPDYVSTGQYYINGTVPPDTVIITPPTAPDDLVAAPAGSNDIELTWTDPASTTASNEAGYRVYRSVDGGTAALRATLPQDSNFFADNNLAAGSYQYYLQVYNSAGSNSTGTTPAVVISAPVVAVATGETTTSGSIASGSYLSTQVQSGAETLTEQQSGGKPKNRTSYLDHQWTVTGVQPAAQVTLEVTAAAPANTESDNFAFTYSLDGVTWQDLGTLLQGDSQTFTATLPGTTSGSVFVRVVDTDRTTGASQSDSVSVYLIDVTSAGSPSETPPTVTIDRPADGKTVAGQTLLSFAGYAEDVQDGVLSDNLTWNDSVDGLIGSGASFTATLSGGTTAVTHVITASVPDSANLVGSAQITVTVKDQTVASTMSVSGLSGSAKLSGKGGKYAVTVTATVWDDQHAVVEGATVYGVWTGDGSGSASCTTGTSGSCTMSVGGLRNRTGSTTFTVTGLNGTLTYDSSSNAVSAISLTAP